jgi:photosystem II stability/assembly factor-like uncharacterized protein
VIVGARARRAAAAVGLAAVVVAAIGAFYLRPWQAFAPASAPARTPRPLALPVMVQQVQFLSGSLGWVVTGRSNSSALYRTTDGGHHWQQQLDGVAGVAWTLLFLDARQGVVTGSDQHGPAIWRTGDGGRHWTRTAPCSELPVLDWFVDLEHGWCLGAPTFDVIGPGPISDRRGVNLFRTADGGAHWSRVQSTDPTHPVSGGLGDDGQKAWIWFRDANTGWIGQNSSGGRAVVYATTDGGDHWSRDELLAPVDLPGSTLGTIEEGPQLVGTRPSPAIVVSPLTPGSQPRQVFAAGRYVYLWRSAAWTGPRMIPNGGPGVVIVDQTHWLVVSGNSVLQTTDEGEQWLALGQVPSGWVVSRLTMADADHGWALLLSTALGGATASPGTGLARTVDGGRHWTLVSAPQS